jgi:hydroxymethylpyrimidine pyrophosphatase-like HAD family hydrolase
MGYVGKPILAIDFDGTIRKSKRATDSGSELMPYCRETLKALYEKGFRMILWTCRSKAWLEEPIKLMTEWDILKYFECINENVKQVYWWNTKKIYSDCYIDDLNLQGFPGWLKTYEILKRKFPESFKGE